MDSRSDDPLKDDFPAPGPPGDAAGRDLVAFWLLALGLILGLVRFYKLGEWSLWMDEALTLTDAQRISDGALHNPVGYGLVVGFAKLFSDHPSEALLRLLPALAGWACLPLSYWAFRPLLSARAAAGATLLLALSPWHLFWSQSARFYTLAQALCIAGSGLYVRGLFWGRLKMAGVGVAIVFASALFHISGALVAGALLVASFAPRLLRAARSVDFDRAALRVCLPALALFLCLSPWLLGWLQHHFEQKPNADLVHFVLTCGYFFGPSLLAGCVYGAWVAFSEKTAAQVFVLAVPVMVLLALSLVSLRALVSAQYAFCVFPFLCALAAAALDSASMNSKMRSAWLLVLALPLVAGDVLYLTSREGERPRWREAWEYVASQREPGDLVIGMGAQVGEHYLGGRNPSLRTPRASYPLGMFFPDGPKRWKRHERSVWMVVRPLWLDTLSAKEKRVVERWLIEDCRLVRRFPVEMEGRDLDLEVWRRE